MSAYFLATQSKSQREACLARDRGICAACGLDTIAEEKRVRDTLKMLDSLRRLENIHNWTPYVRYHWTPDVRYRHEREEIASALSARGIRRPPGAWWQADHRRPLIEANGDLSFWSLDNLQTLCHWCHAAKSREDTRRRRGLDQSCQVTLAL